MICSLYERQFVFSLSLIKGAYQKGLPAYLMAKSDSQIKTDCPSLIRIENTVGVW